MPLLSDYAGRDSPARKIFARAGEKRIAVQIDADEKQTYELDRTRTYHYSMMNLDGLFKLVLMAEKYRVDLWSFQSENGGSLRATLEYLLPYATKEKLAISNDHGMGR